MSTIVTRAGKGSALTHTEVDANFTNLNTDKLQSGNTAASLTITNLSGTTVTYTNATISSATISGGTINSTTVGATTPAAGTFTSLSDSGNLTFTGTGNRITGDFSNATVANRVTFQNSVLNAASRLALLPNGTSSSASWDVFNNSDPTNASLSRFGVTSSDSRFESTITGTGTYLPMTFLTGGSERMRIDTSGNVGIGTSSPVAKLNVSVADGGNIVISNTNDGHTGGLAFGDTSSNSPGRISYDHFSNAMRFDTNGSERARIDSSGNLLVGKTSASATLDVKTTANQQVGRFSLDATSSQGTPAVVIAKKDNTTTTSQVFVQFLINSEGTGSGQINANGASAVAFGSYSDERLKENIVDLPAQLENICALRPVEFDYKAGGHQIGFIAQEMQEVYPDVVGNGSDEMLTITGWSKTEARLVKAIQEQQQMIETLQAKVAALEGV